MYPVKVSLSKALNLYVPTLTLIPVCSSFCGKTHYVQWKCFRRLLMYMGLVIHLSAEQEEIPSFG